MPKNKCIKANWKKENVFEQMETLRPFRLSAQLYIQKTGTYVPVEYFFRLAAFGGRGTPRPYIVIRNSKFVIISKSPTHS